jgi:DNA-binding CsgD family transcriptional regulator
MWHPKEASFRNGAMPIPDIEKLYSHAMKLMGRADLTPAERAEVVSMAQGFACKDSAAAACLSTEAVRACRRRIYEKLGAWHAGMLISTLEILVSSNITPTRLPHPSASVP